MEVEDVIVADKVPGLGGHLELLVIPVDDAHPVRLTVRQIAGQIRPESYKNILPGNPFFSFSKRAFFLRSLF